MYNQIGSISLLICANSIKETLPYHQSIIVMIVVQRRVVTVGEIGLRRSWYKIVHEKTRFFLLAKNMKSQLGFHRGIGSRLKLPAFVDHFVDF